MRQDQFMGLSPEARTFIARNQQVEICPTCGSHQVKRSVIANYRGAFGGEYPLHRHALKDALQDGWADEFLQAAPSGPVHFIGLHVYKDGKLVQTYEWSQEEIEKA